MKKLLLMLLMCAPVATFAQKFGHLNVVEIIKVMPEYTKAMSEIEALAKQYDADQKSMVEEYKKKVQDYQDNEKTLPENIKQRRVQEIQEMEQKAQQCYQDNQQALAKAQQEKLGPIQTKVLDAIKQVGQAGGYVYIMDIQSGVPYISTTLSTDVTAQVKTKLGLK